MKVKSITTSIILVISFQFFLNNLYANCHIEDWTALKALYESTDGSNWLIQTGWDVVKETPTPGCDLESMFGVSLNDKGRVVCIDLDGVNDCEFTNLLNDNNLGNNLRGTIPTEISLLRHLNVLNLAYNKLTGSIPAEVSLLNDLVELNLHSNHLTGIIPSQLGDLSNLKVLYLYDNLLTGNIPSKLGELSNLLDLNLSNNKLSGNIPPELSQLIKLINLSLYTNKLRDSIPQEFGRLTNLKSLWLNNNLLSGSIPDLGKVIGLESLWLDNNQLSGNIPPFLTLLPFLQSLRLNNNEFCNAVPPFLSSLKLNVKNNFFTCEDIASLNSESDNFTYQPQRYKQEGYLGNQSEVIDSNKIGDDLILSINDEFLHNIEELSFQWTKNEVEIKNANQVSYSIESVDSEDAGSYALKITDNSCTPELTIMSEPIFVFVDGFDLLARPVESNQVLIEFDDADEKIEFELSQTEDFAIVDSCNCNRELYLYEFESVRRATDVVLEIDKKVSRTMRKVDVDGGLNSKINLNIPPSKEKAYKIFSDKFDEDLNDKVTIYILDTGLETTFHNSDFLLNDAPVDSCFQKDNLSSGYGYNGISVNTDFTDRNGHGTFGFVALTECINDNDNLNVVPLKVSNANGEGTLFNLVCALYHAIDQNADVINISSSYQGAFSDVFDSAIELARKKEIYIVTSAGNDSTNIDDVPYFPASFAGKFKVIDRKDAQGQITSDTLKNFHIISMTAITVPNDEGISELCDFSNFGEKSVRIAAFGENLLGYDIDHDINLQIAQSGTSFAAFYTTKAFALELGSSKRRKPAKIWEDFKTNWLVDNPALKGKTITGKQINFNLLEAPDNCASNVDDEFAYDISTCFNSIDLIKCPEISVNSCAPVSITPPLNLQDFNSMSCFDLSESINLQVNEETLTDKYFSTTTYTYNFEDEVGNQNTCESQYRIINNFLQKPVVNQPIDVCEGDLLSHFKIGNDQYKIYADNDGKIGDELSACNPDGILCSSSDLGVNTSIPGKYNFWVTKFVNFPDGKVCESEATPFYINILSKPIASLNAQTKKITMNEMPINLMDMVEVNTTGFWSGRNIYNINTMTGESASYFSPYTTGTYKLYYTVKSGNCEGNYLLILEVENPSVINSKEFDDLENTDYIKNEIIKNNEFELYPNPSTGKVFINFTNRTSTTKTFTIFDIDGNALFNEGLKNNNTLNLHHLPKGLYIVEVITDKDMYIKKLIIK